MTIKEIIIAVTIHLIIPMIGLIFYLILIKRMKREEVINPPAIDYFFIFVNYCGLLLISLTSLFWVWSGMASIGTFYLMTVGAILMVVIVIRNSKSRQLSKYHKWAHKLGILYFLITPLTIIVTIAFK
jgi:hypothetical protein